MKTAGIIGGSGFIGSYITKKFLEEGFNVKVSSTDINNKEKYQHLISLSNSNNLEIVELNVENVSMLENFVEGCQILVHGGTPFQLDVKDPQSELFDPTIKGTENVLKVISASPTLKKVVFVASGASYNAEFPMPASTRSQDHIYTEADTPFCDENCHPYGQAKYYADQAVRKFVTDHPDINFEIASVFPVFVVGKPLSGRHDSTSAGLQYLFKNKLAPDPFVEMLYAQNVEFAMVDVTDVAASVYKAATTAGLHGKNYFLTSESWRVSDISLMLNNQAAEGTPNIDNSNDLATKELIVKFKPASVPLNQFGYCLINVNSI